MIQKHAENVGKYGCYFLSILHLAEMISGQSFDALRIYERCVQSKWMDADCYVRDPGAIISYLIGLPWVVRHDSIDYMCLPGEWEIIRYELKDTMNTLTHFVIGDKDGGVLYDPYGFSRTVRDGRAVSKRIFRRA